MKILVLAAAAAAALSLAACASPGLPDLATATAAAKASTADPGAAQAWLAAQKEANRHIELCHRTYTLGWPFSGVVDCPAQNPNGAAPAPSSGVTAAEVQAIVDQALTKAFAAFAAQKAAPPN